MQEIAGLCIQLNKINAQLRNKRRLQTDILGDQRGSKNESLQDSILERVRKPKGDKVISQERKRNPSSHYMIKTITVNQPTTDYTVVLKTDYREAGREAKELFNV